jgi:cytochrome P450
LTLARRMATDPLDFITEVGREFGDLAYFRMGPVRAYLVNHPDLIREIIRERRASGKDHGDLLSMLLLAVDEEGDGTGMSDEQARDEAVTMFNAGHDSTAAALAWIWYLVARHPEVEERLVEETRRVLGSRTATANDLPNLAYTEWVVRESLRLYPPVWALFARVPQADVELGGYTIPAGSWVYIFPWVTQRDARFFENPERFDPERFAPGRVETIPQYAWIPFGGGPHVCIGQTLATSEIVLIVATVLQDFRLSFAPDQPREVVPEPLLAIRPKGGLRMTLAPHPGWGAGD